MNKKELQNELREMGYDRYANDNKFTVKDLLKVKKAIIKQKEEIEMWKQLPKGTVILASHDNRVWSTAYYEGCEVNLEGTRVTVWNISGSNRERQQHYGYCKLYNENTKHLCPINWLEVEQDTELLIKDYLGYAWHKGTFIKNRYNAGGFYPIAVNRNGHVTNYSYGMLYDERFERRASNTEEELKLTDEEIAEKYNTRTKKTDYDNLDYKDLKCGVEIELADINYMYEGYDDYQEIERNLNMFDINTNEWKIKDDGSISPEGVEVVSPPMNRDRFNELKTTLKVLKNMGYGANASCGLHVHHDATGFTPVDVVNLYNIYSRYEEGVLKDILNVSRFKNQYCKSVCYIRERVENIYNEINNDIDTVGFMAHIRSKCVYDDRYYTINIMSYSKHNTIEFRGFQGCSKYNDIVAWIELTSAMMKKARCGELLKMPEKSQEVLTIDDMCEELGITDEKVINTLKSIAKRKSRYHDRMYYIRRCS